VKEPDLEKKSQKQAPSEGNNREKGEPSIPKEIQRAKKRVKNGAKEKAQNRLRK